MQKLQLMNIKILLIQHQDNKMLTQDLKSHLQDNKFHMESHNNKFKDSKIHILNQLILCHKIPTKLMFKKMIGQVSNKKLIKNMKEN